jgi:hypothetical protein
MKVKNEKLEREFALNTLYRKDYFEREKINFWQCKKTPISLAKHMIECVDNITDKKILVLFNLEFIEVLIHDYKVPQENILFIADCKIRKDACNYLYQVESLLIKNHTVKEMEKIMNRAKNKNGKKKFDVTFSNPPYNSNLDVKLIKEAVEKDADEVVYVHPATWILDTKHKNKQYNNLREEIDGKLKSATFFNGNPVFGIGLHVPTMITHIDNNYNGYCSVDYFGKKFESDVMNITKFGAEWKTLVKQFMNKVVDCNNIIDNKVEVREEKNGKYYCQLSAIRGTAYRGTDTNADMVLDDFYTIVMKDSDGNKGIRNPNVRIDGLLIWEFNTELERNNFINYLTTDFARFCLALYKSNANNHCGEMELIPWLDFTQSWDDEKLYKEFDIDEETQDYITNFLPDFHGIREDNN